MITERDLAEAIAECQGERNPNANTCIKLAAFYTIRNEMFGEPSYSFAAEPVRPVDTHKIDYSSDSEFSQIINGRDPDEIWPIMDDLMTTIQTLMPRLYNGVMRKLQD